ncbi:hypothetical protein N0V88_006643 [Collariella sp. IMI 366227]|nr:hypothetical protein N0V88_006643 [Collariella sp. IMI 366227]
MGLRDKFRKKGSEETSPAPEFTFIRTDTHGAEVIHPSAQASDDPRNQGQFLSADPTSPTSKQQRSLDVFRTGRDRSTSESSHKSTGHRRLSQRLHLSRSPVSSENVPQDLPEIIVPAGEEDKEGTELQWEKRATMLARENEKNRSRPGTPVHGSAPPAIPQLHLGDSSSEDTPASQAKVVSSKAIDEDIQEAIRLHESGELEQSTALFGRLADPKGANNPLSQVLYGLALRYVPPTRFTGGNFPRNHMGVMHLHHAGPVTYLSAAASNAADVEHLALQAGLKKGGAAKGELVLAIFELANCFRHGWGIPKDPIAAKQSGDGVMVLRREGLVADGDWQYYETAANLGDTDAMNEVGWCYLEGFGTKKDKFAAAKYYRLAEKNGNKIIGNSW